MLEEEFCSFVYNAILEKLDFPHLFKESFKVDLRIDNLLNLVNHFYQKQEPFGNTAITTTNKPLPLINTHHLIGEE